MKLDFLVPGFSKCGTTTLCSLLNDHPDLFIPDVKELNFFAWKWDRGWDWYDSYFAVQPSGTMAGEGSQGYASAEYADVSARRLSEHFPDLKLIFVARDPVSRLASSYREMHHNGYKYGVYPPFSMLESLQQLPNMIHDTQYWRCINLFRNYFSDDQIHVAFFEDFVADPAATLRTCFEFLHVDPNAFTGDVTRKKNSAAEKLHDTATMRRIRNSATASKMWDRMSHRRRESVERILRYASSVQGPGRMGC